MTFERVRGLVSVVIPCFCAFFFDFTPFKANGKRELYAYRTDGESAQKVKPDNNLDISRRGLHCNNLEEWLRIIAHFEVISTDRAHVMIAGVMLGKQIYYTPTNYHKLPGIAEFLIKEFNVSEKP
ncbi:polysaccharide pyruvyl transferase family protein [Saliterribacillus persicus]|uniref:Polysaccharide pyruvyl transferase n=1 Tax=Saliterribacillus persicus TaxID=930114 RepID=A0A368XNY6_9BACI|nr:polysaccharide pyruvyl transferase family protein [Saliterribacillus persicus]RCW69710.1 polysaccharide pyruvyl transferase [Saliterribacillus persicus]